MNQIEELLKRVLTSLLVDMVISGARGGGEFLKIKIRPVVIRDILYFQVSLGSAPISGEDLLAVKDRADREMYRCKKARKAAMERAGSGRP